MPIAEQQAISHLTEQMKLLIDRVAKVEAKVSADRNILRSVVLPSLRHLGVDLDWSSHFRGMAAEVRKILDQYSDDKTKAHIEEVAKEIESYAVDFDKPENLMHLKVIPGGRDTKI